MVYSGPGDQDSPEVAFADGVYLVVWEDGRNGLELDDIYGSVVSVTGEVQTPGGVAVCVAPNRQKDPAIASDGTGFMVLWEDARGADLDIYGARINSSGTVLEPAVSPDGNSVVFRAMNDAGATSLWVRSFASPSSRELPGTEDAMHPFWSPDGRFIGFHTVATGKLKRIDLVNETIAMLADAPDCFGGAWGADGRILFAPDSTGHPFV